MNPLNENEYVEVEDRLYANPQISLDEGLNFIDNLRASQGRQNQEIAQQTQNLGTDVPSNLGGLTGGEGYFTSRYQTPSTNATVANLRATAQAAALNQVLENEQAMWKKRYQDAYRNYQKRQNARANAPTTTNNPYANVPGDDPDYETTTPQGTNETRIYGYPSAYTTTDIVGNLHVVDMETGEEKILSPGQAASNSRSVGNAAEGGIMRTLPNGNTVLVKTGYELTNENGKYYLVNQNTGVKTEVGGY